jgi:uncharacterized membrane protein YeaQ/YmgE (transglycosylase-associated protein family)
MLDLFGWDVGMSGFAALFLVVGALLIGVAAQFIGEVRVGWEWATTGAGALVGGYLGSEAFGGLSTWGAEFEGLYILPALIGGLVVAIIVDAVSRYATQGSYLREPRPI